MKTELYFNRVGYGLALFPILVLATLFTYALRVSFAVGHWPSYGNPESWSFGFPVHYAILRPWFHVFPLYLFPIISLTYTSTVWILFRRFPRRLFAIFAVTTTILLAYMVWDPGRLLDWFLD